MSGGNAVNLVLEILVKLCFLCYVVGVLGGILTVLTWTMWTFDGPISMTGEAYDRVLGLGKWMAGYGLLVGFLLSAVLSLGVS
jgi:hypothetical protein